MVGPNCDGNSVDGEAYLPWTIRKYIQIHREREQASVELRKSGLEGMRGKSKIKGRLPR